MPINPFTGLEEDNLDPITGLPKAQSFSPENLMVASMTERPRERGAIEGPKPKSAVPQLSVDEPAPIRPSVRDYLLKRKSEREALEKEQGDYDLTGGITGALSAIAAGFQGKDSVAAGLGAVERSAKGRKDALTDFDKMTTDETSKMEMMEEDDINSESSKMANDALKEMGYKGPPVTARQFKKFSPAYEKMFDARQRQMDREAMRDERRYLAGVARQDRLDARADKAKEVKGTEAKQRGLMNMGLEAEGQFNQVGEDYKPTSYFDFIDNSDWAPNAIKSGDSIQARAAQDSWIESFLRDASGAAIPNAERSSYRSIYFPQPGDDEATVKNKAALRAQKIKAAAAGSGLEDSHVDERIMSAQTKKTPGRTVVKRFKGDKGSEKVVYSDGTEEIIPSTAGR